MEEGLCHIQSKVSNYLEAVLHFTDILLLSSHTQDLSDERLQLKYTSGVELPLHHKTLLEFLDAN